VKKANIVWNILFAFTGSSLIIISAMSIENALTSRQARSLAQLDADGSQSYKIRRFKLNKGRYVLPVLHKRRHRVAKSPETNDTAFIQNASHLKLDTNCKLEVLANATEDSRDQLRCIRPN
jgi:hypothetical protein